MTEGKPFRHFRLQTKSAVWQSERNEVILKEKRALPYCCRAVEFFVQALEMNQNHIQPQKNYALMDFKYPQSVVLFYHLYFKCVKNEFVFTLRAFP